MATQAKNTKELINAHLESAPGVHLVNLDSKIPAECPCTREGICDLIMQQRKVGVSHGTELCQKVARGEIHPRKS